MSGVFERVTGAFEDGFEDGQRCVHDFGADVVAREDCDF
jgi:hypothetical protein